MDSENRRLSLGHKQLEENPWDVFETVFTLDSVHNGTIINVMDKGAIVALAYGVEGFAPSRYLNKADGSTAKLEETLDFKVLEFSKDSKKIILALDKGEENVSSDDQDRKAQNKDGAKKAAKKSKEGSDKTTLGDIDVLSALKTEMEESEKSPKKAKKNSSEKGE